MILRSMLFVPGDSEKKLTKAMSVGADALVIDLEDSVAASRKTTGREMVRDYLAATDRSGSELWVRINPINTPDALADLGMIGAARPDGIMLPKAESPQDTMVLGHYLDALEVEHGIERGSIGIVPVATETPGAVFTLGQYKQSKDRIVGLTWGAEDLGAAVGASANLDSEGNWTSPYVVARSLCLFASYAAGVQAIDTVQPNFRDAAALKRVCEESRRDGFTGKLAIHPNQIEVIHEVFTPSAQEIAYSQRVVDAFAAEPDAGVLSLDGHMLDQPHLKQAERILQLARKAGA